MTAPGPDPYRQDKPHPHSVFTDPSGRFLLSADLVSRLFYLHRSPYSMVCNVPERSTLGYVTEVTNRYEGRRPDPHLQHRCLNRPAHSLSRCNNRSRRRAPPRRVLVVAVGGTVPLRCQRARGVRDGVGGDHTSGGRGRLPRPQQDPVGVHLPAGDQPSDRV